MLVLHPRAVEHIAERVERAYRRRHVERYRPGDHAAVWDVVANALIQTHRADPDVPVDPELYVAAQKRHPHWADPWQDLAAESAMRRYRRTVRKIIRQLRDEIRGELKFAAEWERRNGTLETLFSTRSHSISPLGRYIVAHLARRPDLAERVLPEACEQHWSCPLYRAACTRWLPPALYPVRDVLPFGDVPGRTPDQVPRFSLN